MHKYAVEALEDARATKARRASDVVFTESVSYAQGVIDMAYIAGVVEQEEQKNSRVSDPVEDFGPISGEYLLVRDAKGDDCPDMFANACEIVGNHLKQSSDNWLSMHEVITMATSSVFTGTPAQYAQVSDMIMLGLFGANRPRCLNTPIAGEVYKHTHGSHYEVVAVANDSATMEQVVVYKLVSAPQSAEPPVFWTRKLHDWNSLVGQPPKPRFELVSKAGVE